MKSYIYKINSFFVSMCASLINRVFLLSNIFDPTILLEEPKGDFLKVHFEVARENSAVCLSLPL